MSVRRLRPGLFALIALAVGYSPLLAQEPAAKLDSAQLVGRVVSSITGEAIESASVSLRRSRTGAVTDSVGQFIIPTVLAGEDTIEVRFVGYQMSSVAIYLEPEATTRVVLLLSPNVVRVADLEVQIERGDFRLGIREFERRKAKGIGHFVTREDIERWRSRDVSDALRRVPGLRIGASAMGAGSRPTIQLGRNVLPCEPVLIVDGLPWAGGHPDDITVSDVGGIEVYLTPGQIPVQYATLAPTSCGAIMIWTRRGNRPGDR
jgi:hypothetical protein